MTIKIYVCLKENVLRNSYRCKLDVFIPFKIILVTKIV